MNLAESSMSRLCAIVCAIFSLFAVCSTCAAEKIGYNKDIRPILSDKCFHCHGFDQKTRKGKFRLDVREDAVAKGAIVPGKPAESELIKRILSTSEDDVMPPTDAHKSLTAEQKELLKRWIAAGAPYEKHWAYVLPEKTEIKTGRNPIDALVQRHLREVGLKPSPAADRRTLARRLYFDLIGLPPKPEDVEAFAKDKSPDAVPRLIEKLMASPQFGERMAIGWLDVARFADTIGYHSDTPRNVWPYRDYVIKSFNENKPFDQFTREQLAGDLLPHSTQEQKVASAFNRLLLTTEEGGAQSKDYEARMLTDRVRAVSAIWLGQTIGCAQCHDHKFDPITQRDFYSLGAFFADIEEPIVGARGPGMLVPDEKQEAEIKRLDDVIAEAQKDLDAEHPEWQAAYEKWQRESDEAAQGHRWKTLTPVKSFAIGGGEFKVDKDASILVKGKKAERENYTLSFTNILSGVKGLRIEVLPHDSLPSKGPGRFENGNFVLTEVLARVQRAMQTNDTPFASAQADFEQFKGLGGQQGPTWSAASVIGPHTDSDQVGWAVLPEVGQAHEIVLSFSNAVNVGEGETLVLEMKQRLPGHAIGRFRVGVTTNDDAFQGPLQPPPPETIAKILSLTQEQRDAKQKQALYAFFKNVTPEAGPLRKQLADARKARTDYEGQIPRCLVSATNKQPRTVRILPRGNFLVETGDIVQPSLPHYLTASLKLTAERRLNRLDLADWIVSRDNPLTARVVMNRLWKQFFGLGLSRVLDDLGAQGELPPDQPLLDWLACEFMDSGWDMKHMVRLIVNSETYRQTSIQSPQLRARDPLNRELAAQGRWRLDAELVRDNALAVSGLLVEKIGGPSVKPYQPDGYWENLNFPVRTYEASTGPDQYRRGLYVWWQRSYLQPSLLLFDAPSREECAAERNRSNIPQQALVLLNDPTYVEASRVLAARVLQDGGADTKSRLTWAWRQVLDRAPRADEVKTLEALLNKELTEYRDHPDTASALLKTGMASSPQKVDPAELAAWTNLMRVLLNLHETITRA